MQIQHFPKTHAAVQLDTDSDFSSTRMFPSVPSDNESSMENKSEVPSPSPAIYQDIGTDLSRNVRKQMDKSVELTLSLLDTYNWHILRNKHIGKQTQKNIMQQKKKKYDPAMMLRFLYYSDFFKWPFNFGSGLFFP